jgi:hypothetical protein
VTKVDEVYLMLSSMHYSHRIFVRIELGLGRRGRELGEEVRILIFGGRDGGREGRVSRVGGRVIGGDL